MCARHGGAGAAEQDGDDVLAHPMDDVIMMSFGSYSNVWLRLRTQVEGKYRVESLYTLWIILTLVMVTSVAPCVRFLAMLL